MKLSTQIFGLRKNKIKIENDDEDKREIQLHENANSK
jgi:hypothetical protein